MPTSSTDLPPHLRARYGIRRTPWWVIALVAALVAGFAGVVGWVAYTLASPPVTATLLAWDDSAPDHVRVTFEVHRGAQDVVWCVLRAQDEQRIDVGYAVVEVPAGTTYAQPTYALRTLAPAFIVELLGCDKGQPPVRVPPPQFPPGVVPPEQPWTPS